MKDKNIFSLFNDNLIYFFKSDLFKRMLIGVAVLIVSFIIVENGALPKKYNLKSGQKSPYDIESPRDIENEIETARIANEEKEKVQPKIVDVGSENINLSFDSFFKNIRNSKYTYTTYEQSNDPNKEMLKQEMAKINSQVNTQLKGLNLSFADDQITYILSKKVGIDTFDKFESDVKDIVKDTLKDDITEKNIESKKLEAISKLDIMREVDQKLKDIGIDLFRKLLKPNKIIDEVATNEAKEKVYNEVIKNRRVIIKSGDRIINKNEIVTDDKYKILEKLNLLESEKYDYKFSGGIFLFLLILSCILIVYMAYYEQDLLSSTKNIIMLSLIIILTLLFARIVVYFGYSSLAIPIFIAPILISILLNIRLAIVVNAFLTIAVSLITKGDNAFLYMALISGTITPFIVENANKRSKLSIAGLVIAVFNILVIICVGIIDRRYSAIGENVIIVFINAFVSIIFTIGTLPFWEGLFNIVTPLKLLELANPNHPLLKRLLLEAPGTYHHSILVGNLAEVSIEAIGGNPLIARIGAFYHDVGKLKRPNFFKENQLGENPHDKMTPNLSTLVITSHTSDGLELAQKHKIPSIIRDIITQHHGTTLVAYFYHKALKGEKGWQVKEENFRYLGPRPDTREAAVVMLADSVEAAVRSMPDKSEGKMHGVVRKIIRDKLDDKQLDLCDLSLRDLEVIASSFIHVLGGYFHERTEYPKIIREKNSNVVISEQINDDKKESLNGNSN